MVFVPLSRVRNEVKRTFLDFALLSCAKDCMPWSIRTPDVPVFEREARVKFFVTFECAFERRCSSDLIESLALRARTPRTDSGDAC